MSNFFDGIWGALKQPIDEIKWMGEETKGVLKPLLKGDVSESFDSFKGSFGRHNDMMAENVTVPLLGRNKLSENPDAAAGAVLGSVFAAPVLGGMMGGGAAGGGAPVSSAVGMSPAEAIIAGGGNAAEVGSVSTSGAFSRWGNVLNQFGSQMTSGSQAQQVSAPAFKPKFQAQQNPSFGSSVMDQLGAADYNI